MACGAGSLCPGPFLVVCAGSGALCVGARRCLCRAVGLCAVWASAALCVSMDLTEARQTTTAVSIGRRAQLGAAHHPLGSDLRAPSSEPHPNSKPRATHQTRRPPARSRMPPIQPSAFLFSRREPQTVLFGGKHQKTTTMYHQASHLKFSQCCGAVCKGFSQWMGSGYRRKL